ncbi:ribonuclease H-like [Stegodyphus dumicola]|uniref:ribonuclease H-like n=1 Tax=Stegodyphus dumicola TaxID=202533 RepID=UPI0015AABCC4|nr:ribonuclease H-like [Stegodyphus dumicola]
MDYCSISFDRNKLDLQEIEIYTDGSGFEGAVGSAFVVYFYGLEIHVEKFKMSEYNSVYQAEMAALRETLNWILRELTKRHCIHIYSDALSVLTALSRPEPKNEILEDIKDLFKRALGYHVIHVHWIKAHIGHSVNERADALAKEAALGDGMDYFDVRPVEER